MVAEAGGGGGGAKAVGAAGAVSVERLSVLASCLRLSLHGTRSETSDTELRVAFSTVDSTLLIITQSLLGDIHPGVQDLLLKCAVRVHKHLSENPGRYSGASASIRPMLEEGITALSEGRPLEVRGNLLDSLGTPTGVFSARPTSFVSLCR